MLVGNPRALPRFTRVNSLVHDGQVVWQSSTLTKFNLTLIWAGDGFFKRFSRQKWVGAKTITLNAIWMLEKKLKANGWLNLHFISRWTKLFSLKNPILLFVGHFHVSPWVEKLDWKVSWKLQLNCQLSSQKFWLSCVTAATAVARYLLSCDKQQCFSVGVGIRMDYSSSLDPLTLQNSRE